MVKQPITFQTEFLESLVLKDESMTLVNNVIECDVIGTKKCIAILCSSGTKNGLARIGDCACSNIATLFQCALDRFRFWHIYKYDTSPHYLLCQQSY
jgi:hypothetical protein